MKIGIAIAVLLMTLGAPGQQSGLSLTTPQPIGEIHGIVTGLDGQPATGVGISADFLCQADLCPIRLSSTFTNQAGEYRFSLYSLGRYSVYADDANAGYSLTGTPLSDGTGHPWKLVELTNDHPNVDLPLRLPPKAGFLTIRLTDKVSGKFISWVTIKATLPHADSSESSLFEMSRNCAFHPSQNQECIFLVPPDKPLLVHVSSKGFQEWDRSVGKGMLVLIHSGEHLIWDVQLEPVVL